MTRVSRCHMIDCRNIDRDENSCMLEAVEIGGQDRTCLSYEPDYKYMRWELKERAHRSEPP